MGCLRLDIPKQPLLKLKAIYGKSEPAQIVVQRFIGVDPLFRKYSYNSNYAFSENSLINAVELEGLEKDLSFHSDPSLRSFKEDLDPEQYNEMERSFKEGQGSTNFTLALTSGSINLSGEVAGIAVGLGDASNYEYDILGFRDGSFYAGGHKVTYNGGLRFSIGKEFHARKYISGAAGLGAKYTVNMVSFDEGQSFIKLNNATEISYGFMSVEEVYDRETQLTDYSVKESIGLKASVFFGIDISAETTQQLTNSIKNSEKKRKTIVENSKSTNHDDWKSHKDATYKRPY